VRADKAYSSRANRAWLRRRGIAATIPEPADQAGHRTRRGSAGGRLALEMVDEMAGPGGWGALERVTAAGRARPVAVADAGYGDNTTFRLELENRDWQYVVAVKGATSAYAGDVSGTCQEGVSSRWAWRTAWTSTRIPTVRARSSISKRLVCNDGAGSVAPGEVTPRRQ
jgi:hypothetical protein